MAREEAGGGVKKSEKGGRYGRRADRERGEREAGTLTLPLDLASINQAHLDRSRILRQITPCTYLVLSHFGGPATQKKQNLELVQNLSKSKMCPNAYVRQAMSVPRLGLESAMEVS